jgi:hypothetical protein
MQDADLDGLLLRECGDEVPMAAIDAASAIARTNERRFMVLPVV